MQNGARISRDHPLRTLFQELVHKHLFLGAQLYDTQIAHYVTGVLTDFTHVDNLYRIRNVRGRLLEDVVELLIESNPLLDASSFIREREVRKQIGDFTLFSWSSGSRMPSVDRREPNSSVGRPFAPVATP